MSTTATTAAEAPAKSKMPVRTFQLTFTLRKATKNALQYVEQVREGEPERMGTLYLKKWTVPQPYPEYIVADITIPVGKDLSSGGTDPAAKDAAYVKAAASTF